jgi:hypothetical protein
LGTIDPNALGILPDATAPVIREAREANHRLWRRGKIGSKSYIE